MSGALTRDPWPSPHPAWHDPPWVLTGRVVTAWFPVDWEVLERSLSPDLRPEPTAEVRIRLRFYDLRFEAIGRNPGQALAPTSGTFKEAVVGFPARGRGIDGESSMFMWTDSDTYLMWAREAFGWPLLKGEISLDGPIWTAEEIVGTTGGANLASGHGRAALVDANVRDRSDAKLTTPCWLTPRRILTGPSEIIEERRELLAVRPSIRDEGERFSGEGRVTFDFSKGHPLESLRERHAELDVIDGFELLVAESVELI